MMQDWLVQRAARSPERVALAFESRVWTWRELDARANECVAQLAARGISERERVALLMRNSDTYVVLVHALARRGAILVPLHTRLTANELEWQLERAPARFLIWDERNEALASKAARKLTDLSLIPAAALESASHHSASAVPHSPFELDAPHSILFTSGTTGKPKGAVLTFGNHWWNAIGSALNLGLYADDVWLDCMPLFHIGGLAILLRSVIYGNPVVLHESFDAAAVNRALDEQRVTLVSLVSTMLQRVLETRGERPFPPTLRCILLGGGPVSRSLLERCAQRHVPVAPTYGLTEAASQVATLAPHDARRKLGAAGKPLMGLELRIERASEPEGGAVSPSSEPKGNVGEIVIRGPMVTEAYAGGIKATTGDGWFHTGDLGYLDDEGFLYVVARREDLIVSGGENIYPAEVEAVLNAHPAIQEAAVIGVPDAEWGQTPIAYCVLRDQSPVRGDELKTYCAENLARYKIPTRFVFVETLPRNAAGKIVRRELAAAWESEQTRENQPRRE